MKKCLLVIITTLTAISIVSCKVDTPPDIPLPSPSETVNEPVTGSPVQHGYQKITPQEAEAMMDGIAVILDVRTQEEYDAGHIENAVLLPDYEIGIRAESVLTDRDQTILIYCRTGRRSANAAKELAEMGYTNVYDFGGIVDWHGAVVTDTPVTTGNGEQNGHDDSSYHAVVYDGFLLGGSDSTGWLKPKDIAQSIKNGDLYKLYSFEEFIESATGSAVPPEPAGGGEPYAEFVDINSSLPEDEYIAINCDWECLPRKAVPLSLDYKDYIEDAARILTEQGLNEPVVNIVQCYRIDLDNDGADEVILYAEHSSDMVTVDDGMSRTPFGSSLFATKKGDYSLLLIRKIVNGSVQTFVLDSDIHIKTTTPENDDHRIRYFFEICGFYDLNGDGKIEIVTRCRYYEGTSYDVWEVTDKSVDRVIGNGWGV